VRDHTPDTRSRNNRIVLVRLLCIFGMIYVHVPLMEVTTLSSGARGFSVFELLQALLVDGYGRTSACLLSIVSGYLVVKTLNGKTQLTDYLQFYKRRFKSIYLPMVMWGMVTLLVFSFVSIMQITFLSDTCGGKSLIVVMRFIPLLGLSALSVVYLLDLESMLILRPLVILGFSVGLTIGLQHLNFAWVDRFWIGWLFMVLLMALLTTAFNSGQLPELQWLFAVNGLDARESLLYPLTRVFGSLAIWSLALKLMSLPVVNWSIKLEPFLFVAFCSHPLLLSMLQELSRVIVAASDVSVLYPAWFVLAPAVSIAASVLGMRLCGLLLPNFLQNFMHMFSGGAI